jgi:hypothetical protein
LIVDHRAPAWPPMITAITAITTIATKTPDEDLWR